MDDVLRRAALEYHRNPMPGKLAITATKRLATQHDLALAYSPGVAAPCEAIAANPDCAAEYTARANLVAVVTNGTAVLGLGNIGPLASKPVMEGKAVLFKKFAGIDVFDIELDAPDPDRFVEIVAALEPTFGGINLEDVKAPECFEIERRLRERMNIPVFHDDQHGTAIVAAAAIRNALQLQGKSLGEVRLVTSGAGAAALACVNLLVAMGLPRANVTLTDIDGVVHSGRANLDADLAVYARPTDARSLPDVLPGTDIFLGLSAPRVLKPEWLPLLAPNPLILAMANPEPEILPEIARELRPDAIVATGRSDYPNQVNNVLCFPYIFRGALDVGATEINDAMKLAAVEAIATLARAEVEETVAAAYGGAHALFGPDYIIPKPFDPRLLLEIAPAVAKAASDSGVARQPLTDVAAYKARLGQLTYRSAQLMIPVFEAARRIAARVAYGEGEDDRVLRAVQTVVDENLARPVLVARRRILTEKIRTLGLRLVLDRDVEVVDPESGDPMFERMTDEYKALVVRKGVVPESAARSVTRRPTVTAAMLLRMGQVDAAVCGGNSDWWEQTKLVFPIVPRAAGVERVYALSALILPVGTLFIGDTHINLDPDAAQIAEMTTLAADAMKRFGIEPRAALLSHSNFGASNSPSAAKMRAALKLLRARNLGFAVDGEMHADAALSPALRGRIVHDSPLEGPANLLVAPNLDAANIAATLLASAAEAQVVGPMFLGLSKPVNVLVPSVTARGIVNLTAVVAAHANRQG
ncbi:NADP-dependent malic enzyme [Sphingoaurantiacus capsulatus]|uniref:NADP-dependent malic enzyme n=1 Tax=Sphingoaurantiacus capsulatus TaxID=1771310 RepID=A0ABV7X8A1_9SPHN